MLAGMPHKTGSVNGGAGECLTPPLANPLVAERAFRASEFWALTRVSEVHGK